MRQTPERFFAGIKDKKVWFVGIGVSNTDTISLFAAQGISVTACDKRGRDQLGDVCDRLESQGVRLLVGGDYPAEFSQADILFRTPGMYYHAPELEEFRSQGGILTSEMEVFFDLCPCHTIAVTGSDGKTTTTTLIAELLKAQGRNVQLGGNIGKALLPLIFDIKPDDFAVVELSSFQLISMRSSPDVAVVTNVTPNHLDVHGNMDEYISAKLGIVAHQNAFSRTVLSADNELSASFAAHARGDVMYFSLEKPVEHGAYLNSDGILCVAERGKPHLPLLKREDIRIPGMHNAANYLAAICAVRGLVQPDSIRKVAGEFGGVEHRLELAADINGVRWYNDSIATSPTRAAAGLKCFEKKIILIAGGYDKKLSFDPLAPYIVDKVSALILTGPTAPMIEAAVTAIPGFADGSPRIIHAENLEHAVNIARELAVPGDIVSLSPACASFDAYPNFEVRGRHFKKLVNEFVVNNR